MVEVNQTNFRTGMTKGSIPPEYRNNLNDPPMVEVSQTNYRNGMTKGSIPPWARNNYKGGVKDYSGTYRHFKIVHLNGKDVNFDYSAKIKDTQTPLNAAKKLLKSICLHMGLKGMKKLQCNAKFVIKETTQGSEKKMFGPYKGSYIKYTPAEAKKAMASGISFKMKPSVKLSKKMSPKNKSPMKG